MGVQSHLTHAPPTTTYGNRPSRIGSQLRYLLVALPVAICSFTVLLSGLVAGTVLLVTVAGLPVVAWTLRMARVFGDLNRRRAARLGADLAPVGYLTTHASGWRRWMAPLSDRQLWLDLSHGLVVFPVSLAAWVIVVAWWATGWASLFYPFYGWAIEPNAQGWGDLLGVATPWADAAVSALMGGLLLVTAIPLTRVLTSMHLALDTVLLQRREDSAVSDRVEQLLRSREAAASAEVREMRRLERDLHDGPQQRLVRLSMDLDAAQRRLNAEPDAAQSLLADAIDQTHATLAEIRALSRGVAPPILSDRGLIAALESIAGRSHVPVDLQTTIPKDLELPATIEAALYFIAAECLTNVAKHSAASACALHLQVAANTATLEVTDNGIGGAQVAAAHGLAGLEERVLANDGRLYIESPPGGPTRVRVVLPCG